MSLAKSAIERAIEIAATGECKTVTEIRMTLRREGYVGQHIDSNLAGGGIRAQLKRLMRNALNPV